MIEEMRFADDGCPHHPDAERRPADEAPPVTTAEFHPVQTKRVLDAKVSSLVTLRAYEVYAHVWGEQKALIRGGCRGGFSTGELIAFLYAHSFPKEEWRARAAEAFDGMNL